MDTLVGEALTLCSTLEGRREGKELAEAAPFAHRSTGISQAPVRAQTVVHPVQVKARSPAGS